MKKLLLLLLFSLSINSGIAQKLQTHKGKLKGYLGNETYTFYTNTETGEEVRQGTYNYLDIEKNNEGASSTTSIKGRYTKGNKDGAWIYTHKLIDVDNGYGNNYVTSTAIMTMTYKDGMPNGLWKYTRTSKSRSRKYSFAGWSWGGYTTYDPDNISVTFDNGVMVGDVTYKTAWIDVFGKLDNEGWHTGIWKIDNQGTTLMFVNGVALHDPKDKELMALQREFANTPDEQRDSLCFEKGITATLMPSKNFFDINDGYFNNSMWWHREIGGDRTYATKDGLNYHDTKDYGQYYYIERTKYRDLESINSYWRSSNSEKLKEILKEHIREIDKNDRLTLSKAIEGVSTMEEIDPKFVKVRNIYNNLNNFKPDNKGYIKDNLIPGYNKLVKIAKSNLNSAINADEINDINSTLYTQRSWEYYPRSYSEEIDYKSYQAKVDKIAPVANSFIDSLQNLNLLYDKLLEYSKSIPATLDSKLLKPSLQTVLDNRLKSNITELEKINSTTEAISYTKTMRLTIDEIRRLDKLHASFEEYIESKPKKLLKAYYEIAEESLSHQITSYNYIELKNLCDAAEKIEPLVGTKTNTLEKAIKKEKTFNGKIKVILEW